MSLQADFTFQRYITASLDALFLRDVVTGLIKSFMFGITITAVGCHEGLSHRRWRGASGSFNNASRGDVDLSGDSGGPGLYHVVLLPGRTLSRMPEQFERSDEEQLPDGPMISLRDLRVSYDGREILHGINFDVQRGETLVILGGSGSGKSTLLRTLVGLEIPSSGEVWIRGKNFRGNLRRRTG